MREGEGGMKTDREERDRGEEGMREGGRRMKEKEE